jgi:hypothetical protein
MRKFLARFALVAVLVTGATVATAGIAQGYSLDQGGGLAIGMSCDGESIYTTGSYWITYTESDAGAKVALNLQGTGFGDYANYYNFAMFGGHSFSTVADEYTFTGGALFFSMTAGFNITYDSDMTVLVDHDTRAPIGFYGSFANRRCYVSNY